jgi:hypothetical protein
MTARRRPGYRTTTEKGLGWRHQQQVARLKRELIPGTKCWWCNEPMFVTQGLAGDHEIPRSQGGILATRLLHLDCNSARGDGSRDHLRPAVTGIKPQPAIRLSNEREQLAMRWP